MKTKSKTSDGGYRLLPAITTTPGSDWKEKIREINRLDIREAAIFPTCLDKSARRDLYELVKKSCIKKVPFVHLRSDMDADEIEYLIREFKTERFNLHTVREFPFDNDYSKYADLIYVENVYYSWDEKEVGKYAGVCIDFSHLENDRLLYKDKYEHNIRVIESHAIGCNHLSAIKKESTQDVENRYDKLNIRYDSHECAELSEFDYLKNYPRKYFTDYAAIEIENSIEFQLRAKKYVEDIISKLE